VAVNGGGERQLAQPRSQSAVDGDITGHIYDTVCLQNRLLTVASIASQDGCAVAGALIRTADFVLHCGALHRTVVVTGDRRLTTLCTQAGRAPTGGSTTTPDGLSASAILLSS
jgi:hypothetical protein